MEGISLSGLVGAIIRLFLLLSPFCTLSLYLGYSDNLDGAEQRKFGIRISTAIWVICLVFYFFGRIIFDFLGITLDAFRIGCGLVLMLSGIDLVRDSGTPKARELADGDDPAVVPLAIPCTVGPGTIGALLVMGTKVASAKERIFDCVAIVLACIGVGLMLYYSHGVSKVLKDRGVKILSKLTGMYLVALAAQIMADGVRGFLK